MKMCVTLIICSLFHRDLIDEKGMNYEILEFKLLKFREGQKNNLCHYSIVVLSLDKKYIVCLRFLSNKRFLESLK